MTTKGTDKINPEEEFKIRWEIDHMQWRIDPDCDGGSNYELFQNYSIIDREGDTAGLLLPVDREVKTGADNWHEFQVIQDDCGTSPDDGQNRDLQKIQFKPATGKP